MSYHPARTLALVGTLAITACGEPHVVTTTADDLERIRVSTEQFVATVRAGEFDALSDFYTVDAVLMPPNEPVVEGRKAIEEWFAAFPPIEDLQLEILEVDGHEDLLFVRGSYILTLAASESQPAVSDTGKYLEVRHRVTSGDWLITVDMFSSNLPVSEGSAVSAR